VLREPIIDEIRRVREHEAARQGFDVKQFLRLRIGGNGVPGTRSCR